LPQYQAILRAYLADITFPPNARVLEVGCGTGAVARLVAQWPQVAEVVGVDPSPALLDKARTLSARLSTLSFQEADGKALPFPASTFDVVVLHTVLTHVPGPDALLAEVFRVLRPQGSVGIGDDDPLQTCVDAFVEHFVHDPWLVRRLSPLARAAGGPHLDYPCPWPRRHVTTGAKRPGRSSRPLGAGRGGRAIGIPTATRFA
jgi:ubiquinone/menaquinone biosynthesis C-methylase UbiE